MNDEHEMMTEEYFERSGCGCMVAAAIIGIVAILVALIIAFSI